jgi:hypothetical protein
MTETGMAKVSIGASLDVFIETASLWLAMTEVQLAFAAVLFMSVFVLVSRKKSTKLKKDLAKLQKDLLVANSTTIGMGQKLMGIEKQLLSQEKANKLTEANKTNENRHDQSLKNARASRTATVQNEQCRNDLTSNHMYKKPDNAVNHSANNTVNSIANLSLVNNDFLHNDELPNDEAYEKSRQLLSQGVDIPEVVKQSGLSFSEVSLMQKLAR